MMHTIHLLVNFWQFAAGTTSKVVAYGNAEL